MQLATAYKKKDGLYLHSQSETTVGGQVATPPFIRVGSTESELAKGIAVLAVLQASMKTVVPHPEQDEWDSVFRPMLELAGVRTLGGFEKDAVCCGLEVEGNQLKIVPHRRIRRSGGYEPIEAEAVILGADSQPAEIGVALKEAFGRCER